MPDWAETRAREWLENHWPGLEELGCYSSDDERATETSSLAALLREVVAERDEHACGEHIKARLDEYRAEVRRVALEATGFRSCHCGGEILSRLERL